MTIAGLTRAVSVAQLRLQLAGLLARGSSDADVLAAIADIRAVLYAETDSIFVGDYNAAGDGTTDDTTAIQAAATAAAGKRLVFSPGTYRITAAIALSSDTEVVGDGEAVVQSADATISLFAASAKARIRIRGIHFKYTVAGATPYIGGVFLDTCTYCVVDGCRFEAMQWGAVYMTACTYCVVRGCHMHGATGTAQDSADVCMRGLSSYNLVESNRLLGGAGCDHGVLIQDHDGNGILQHNIVRGNRIEVHAAYGVACYQTTARDQFTLIEGNDIRDIDGSVRATGASGMGVYIQTAGGCVVNNNNFNNCNAGTVSNANLAASISLSFDFTLGATLRPCVVSGNYVDTSHYMGIACSAERASIVGNVVRTTDVTNGKGIYVQNASNVSVTGNRVELAATGKNGIQAFSNAGILTGLVISGNVVTGGNDAVMQINVTGAYTITASITGNNIVGAGANALALIMSKCKDCVVSGNYLNGTLAAWSITDSTGIRAAANVCRSSNFTLLTAGTCSGNVFDQTNDFDTNLAHISNAVAGGAVEIRSNAAPGAGSWQVGDRVQQTVPVVGQPKGWLCTVAGSAGTWVSEGAL